MKRQPNGQLNKLKPYLLLLVILLLAFLPLSSFHFAMKNDAFSDNFPNKFFLTLSLRSGLSPLWNPYLNFGFPIYADPGFAFWNPVTWIFAVIGYNAYVLTVEVLLYIYLAGLMMYRLARYLQFDRTTTLVTAAMYMCSGFFTGQLQHINFLASAAFLPFLMHQLLYLFNRPGYRSAALFALSLYLVFAGGHPAIPVATIYFVLALGGSLFFLDSGFNKNSKKILSYLAISILLFALLYSPALYSYLSIFSDYGRHQAVDQGDSGAIHSGFSPSSYLSIFYPFATVKGTSFLADDLSMRNIYFSLAGFVLGLTQTRNRSYLVRSLMIASVVMAVLSCGGAFKTVVFSNLPMLSYIKTNGEFRVFILLCLCLLAGHGFNNLDKKDSAPYLLFKRIITVLIVLDAGLLLYLVFSDYRHLFAALVQPNTSQTSELKAVMDAFTFRDSLLLAVVLNLACLVFLWKAKVNKHKLAVIIVADLIINGILYLPFSGVGRVTLGEIQSTYNKSGNSIVTPPMIRIKDIDTLPAAMTGLVGSWTFYNKKIGTVSLTNYPSYFSRTAEYFNSGYPEIINSLPYLFFKNNSGGTAGGGSDAGKIKVTSFSPVNIQISVNSQYADTLVLLQNYYRFWRVNVDGRPVPVKVSHITFMSVAVPGGAHSIVFSYLDPGLPVFITIAIIGFVIVCLLIRPFRKFNTTAKDQEIGEGEK